MLQFRICSGQLVLNVMVIELVLQSPARVGVSTATTVRGKLVTSTALQCIGSFHGCHQGETSYGVPFWVLM